MSMNKDGGRERMLTAKGTSHGSRGILGETNPGQVDRVASKIAESCLDLADSTRKLAPFVNCSSVLERRLIPGSRT